MLYGSGVIKIILCVYMHRMHAFLFILDIVQTVDDDSKQENDSRSYYITKTELQIETQF